MKYTSLLFVLLTFLMGSLELQSQTQEFEVEGVKVLLKPSNKQVISVQLFLDGGTSNYTKEQEGIEALALAVVTEGGTQNHPKTDFFGKLEKMGSIIGNSAEYDYSKISLRCLTSYWDESWDLFADAVRNPAFEEEEFNNIKNQLVAGAKNAESDADSHLRNIAMSNAFKDLNYSKVPDGTASSLEKLSWGQVQKYYKRLLGKDQIVLVVVGAVEEADLKAKVKKAFGDLKAEGIQVKPEGKVFFNESSYNEESRDIATNYIRGYMNAPDIGSDDEVAMRVAYSILYDRLFKEIRTERNLSYAPAAAFPSSILGNPYTLLYVSTDKPNEAVAVMINEIRDICKEGFEASELTNKKGDFLTQHYMKMETVGSQATGLGQATLSGDWKRTDKFIDEVDALSVEDLNKAFKKYAKGINWTYLGDTSLVNKSIFLQSIGD